jgi:hypothetical protein
MYDIGTFQGRADIVSCLDVEVLSVCLFARCLADFYKYPCYRNISIYPTIYLDIASSRMTRLSTVEDLVLSYI